LAFDLGRSETALHYLDAVIAEDARNFPEKWSTMPGAEFLRLAPTNNLVGMRAIPLLRSRLDTEIDKFNSLAEH